MNYIFIKGCKLLFENLEQETNEVFIQKKKKQKTFLNQEIF